MPDVAQLPPNQRFKRGADLRTKSVSMEREKKLTKDPFPYPKIPVMGKQLRRFANHMENTAQAEEAGAMSDGHDEIDSAQDPAYSNHQKDLFQAYKLLKQVPGMEEQCKALKGKLQAEAEEVPVPASSNPKTLHVAYQQALAYKQKCTTHISELSERLDQLLAKVKDAETAVEAAKSELARAESMATAAYKAVAPTAETEQPPPPPTQASQDLGGMLEAAAEKAMSQFDIFERKFAISQDSALKEGVTPPDRTRFVIQEALRAMVMSIRADSGGSEAVGAQPAQPARSTSASPAAASAAPAAPRAERPREGRQDRSRSPARDGEEDRT